MPERRYRALLEVFSDFVFVTSPEGELLTDMPLWRRWTGQSPEDLLGSGWLEAIHADDRDRVLAVWLEAVHTRGRYDVSYRIVGGDTTRWLDARAAPVIDAEGEVIEWVGVVVDVTGEREARAEVARDRDVLEQVIAQAPQPMCVLWGPRHEYRYFNDLYTQIVPPGRVRVGVSVLDALPETADAGGPLLARVMSGETIVQREVAVPFGGERAFGGLRYYDITLGPLVVNKEVLGVLSLAREVTIQVRDRDDLERRLAHERDSAERLQRALLPERLPDLPGVTTAVHYAPAPSELGVGGDFYDALAIDDDRLLLVVGDVCGRGLEAARVMAQLQAALRAYAVEDPRPAEILRRLAHLCATLGLCDLVTIGVGLLDLRARRLDYADAGHLPFLLLRPGAGAELVTVPGGPPLGAGDGRWVEASIPLPAEAELVFFTDGVVEERGRSLDDTLEELRVAVEAEHARVEDLCALVRDVAQQRAGDDDAAVLAVRLAA